MLQPLRFHPIIKRIRWGGTRLGSGLGKPIGDIVDAAESWEIADHGIDQSIVRTGPFSGWPLSRLMSEHPVELLGLGTREPSFPLLVKFLDAQDRLSLQVHPNDAQAQLLGPDQRGKTEAWIILEAQPGSLIYAGLRPGVRRTDLEAAILSGRLADCVHSFEPQPGDCCFIPAGTVHAIGEGILLAEIQQTSDITYRLHDWGRLGSDGKPRSLHITEALNCIDYDTGPVTPLAPALPVSATDHGSADLLSCPFFSLHRHTGRNSRELAKAEHFRILMLLDGRALLHTEAGSEALVRGDTVLIPASCPPCRLIPQGPATILEVRPGVKLARATRATSTPAELARVNSTV